MKNREKTLEIDFREIVIGELFVKLLALYNHMVCSSLRILNYALYSFVGSNDGK